MKAETIHEWPRVKGLDLLGYFFIREQFRNYSFAFRKIKNNDFS